ncbi:glycosyltransferase [Nitrososphaera sp.]|uniref:glycosyltransferase n=1 Tax=Nitrososphaera sp. TaxID=1971748 RepID=UPI0017D80AA6|nr:glycosyltransferase [Nitrososphaera sp.]NWG36556.1 UDP-glucuronosyltransferase [Nitrososphaera sp.]
MFFTSPIGLGHATRDIAIADKLGISKSELMFVSGEGAPALIEKSGYRCLDLYRPEKFSVDNGQLQHSFRWLMAYYSYYKKCKEIAGRVIAENPGPVISDEDFASIAIAEEAGRKHVLVTDILETHFTKGAASLVEKKMNRAMREMMDRCDCVIIPDVGEDRGNLRYVGPIVREVSADRETLRRRFNLARKTIVVSVGGTDAGRYLIEKTIEAYRKLKGRLDADLLVVPGPSLKLPDSPDYRNLGFVENLHELVYAADLVISLAGRSTMDESMAYGTPGIFIPIKGHFEQEEGAARLGYSHGDILRLEPLIEETIGRRRDSVNAAGAKNAAKIISALFR